MRSVIFCLTFVSFGVINLFAQDVNKKLTYLDSLNLNNEVVLFATDSKTKIDNNIKAIENVQEPVEKKATNTTTIKPNGFRIQIIALSSVDAIRKKKIELEELIMLPLYISFRAPTYKLLAGNFSDRSSASRELEKIKSIGISDAWIVSSEIFLRK